VELTEKELLNDTPFIAVDLDIMEKNINWLANLAKEAKVKLRPHTKTHKSPWIAQKQIDAGACGITTAKLTETEVMINRGITDILVAFPIVGRKKLEKFSELFSKAKIITALDDYKVAQGLNEVGEYHKTKVPIYVDIDTGLGRMGRTPKESIDEILNIAKLRNIEIIGLMSHVGHAYKEATDEAVKKVAIEDATLLYQTKEALEKAGVYIPEISVGSTATVRFIKETPFITEVRAGTYVFNDRAVMGTGGATEVDCAVTVFATVVSKPSKERLIIDAGSKTLTQDLYREGGFGYIKGFNNLVINRLSEEHGIIEIKGDCSLEIGDVIEIIPNHVCPVINLADKIYGFRSGMFEKEIIIEGRGKNR